MTHCTLCGDRTRRPGELPSGQPVCPLCEYLWPEVLVYVTTGTSSTVHLLPDCLAVRQWRTRRDTYDQRTEGPFTADVKQKTYRMLPNRGVCRDCQGQLEGAQPTLN